MKRIYVHGLPFLALATFGHGLFAATIALDRDTPVPLRLTRSVSSAKAKVNERVEFEVVESVKAGGRIVIPQGSAAWGRIADAEPAGLLTRPGRLSIDIVGVCLADGRVATLRGAPHTRKNSITPVSEPGDNVLMLPALPLMIFMHGKNVEIPAGKPATAYLDRSMRVDLAKAADIPAPDCSRPSVRQPGREESLAALRVGSTPDGAQISVDGKYAGDTPATLRLPSGDHVIAVTAPGAPTYQRTIHLTPGGDSRIAVQMDKPDVLRRPDLEATR